MSHAVSEEERARKSRAIFNCSMAMRDAIRSYGFAAILHYVVRISNYDPIVSELLPYLPSIASAIMLEDWSLTLGSRNAEENPEGPGSQGEFPKPLAGQGNKEITKPI